MKPILFVCLLFCTTATVQAQISLGLRGGVNKIVGNPSDISINSGDTSYIFGLENARVGYQFGGYVRIGMGLYIQPEIMFNSSRADYHLKNTTASQVFQETYNYLDMPLMVGFKAGPLNFHGGPVGHYFLNSKSELTDVEGYEARFEQFTWGWAAGVGLGLGGVGLDLRYEGNFKGDHVTFFGDEYNLSSNPGRLTLNMSIRLVGN